MEYIQLKSGEKLSRIGLGTMRLHDDKESVDTILKAIDSGVNFINCGDFYNSGLGELAVREALKSRKREDVFISVKFGGLKKIGGGLSGIDVAPEHVENYLAYTLNRLGVDYVDLYEPSRINPHIPVEDTLGAIARLKEKGYVRHIGMTEVDAETLRRGNEAVGVDLVELNYNIMDRHYEDTTMAEARKQGIPIAAFGVLLAGVIGGSHGQQTANFLKKIHPGETASNFDRNLEVRDKLQVIADRHNISLAQLAMAWVLAQGNDITAIVGSHRPSQAESSAAAADIQLTAQDLADIEALVPKTEAKSLYQPVLTINEKGLFEKGF